MKYGRVLLALMTLISLGTSCRAQDLHKDIPSFAHYTAGEQGWACDDGYKQVAGFCVKDQQHASTQDGLEVFDGEWRCRPGYRRTDGVCSLPTAPEHASMVGVDRWECDWGYKKVAQHCDEIAPPAHAYLDAEGRDWTCFPGYERESDHCTVAVATPKTTAPAEPPASEPKPAAEPQPPAASPQPTAPAPSAAEPASAEPQPNSPNSPPPNTARIASQRGYLANTSTTREVC